MISNRSANSYMTADEFSVAVGRAAPGGRICYAVGDLANAAKQPEVSRLRRLAQFYQTQKMGFLTQRRRDDLPADRGGASFEYWFTKARPADG
jgi:hypothetical protein